MKEVKHRWFYLTLIMIIGLLLLPLAFVPKKWITKVLGKERHIAWTIKMVHLENKAGFYPLIEFEDGTYIG